MLYAANKKPPGPKGQPREARWRWALEGASAGALAKYELALTRVGNPHGPTILAHGPVPSSDPAVRLECRTYNVHIFGSAHLGAHPAQRGTGVSRTIRRPLPSPFASYIARSASRSSCAADMPGRQKATPTEAPTVNRPAGSR